jgi:hypothetical protein
VKASTAIVYVAVALAAVAGWAYDSTPVKDLPFAVEVSPADIGFHIDGPPGLYPSSQPVTISVRSGFADWTLFLQASPLVEVTRGWVVPASRILIEGGFQDVAADEAGFVGLGQPVLVASGEFTGPDFEVKAVLDLQMISQGTDRPGTYRGQIVLTFLATP